MAEEEKRKYKAIGMSLLVHLLLFVVVALTGLFVQVSAADKKPIDVVVYDADAGESGSAGGGSAAPAAEAASIPSVEDIVLKENIQMPEIAEEYTKTPEKQREYKQTHQEEPSQAAVGTTTAAVSGGSGQNPMGSGTGAGAEAGTGSGAGIGSGSGNGTGSGSGDGRDPAAAQRPKTPPQLLSASAPAYPEGLRQQSVEGAVRVRMLVGTDGSVESAEVSESSGYGEMDAAAVNAAYGYRFSPALNVYGEPVACHITRRIRFDLR